MFFDIIDNKLALNKEYILSHKPFENILIEYKSRGFDFVESIFKYIYEIADYRSISNRSGKNEEDAHRHGVEVYNLPHDFLPCSLITKAITKYKNLNYNRDAELLGQLKATLSLSSEINDKIRKALERSLEKDGEMSNADLNSTIALQNKLFEVIEGLPEKFKTIKQLESSVYTSLHSKEIIGRGGEVIPESYNGDPDIESV